jgi:hypothetical protein
LMESRQEQQANDERGQLAYLRQRANVA